MTDTTPASSVVLLDGGMGRELLRMGAPFAQPEWSALALMQAPHQVQEAHEHFAIAGSDIITTNSYALVPYHIGEERFLKQGQSLAALSGKLAAKVAEKYGCRVAGSLPPLFGSYRPDLFVPARAQNILQPLIDGLGPYVDLWLAETVSSIAEAKIVLETLSKKHRPVWVAYTILDGDASISTEPRLRSGEKVVEAVRSAVEYGAAAILFNCSHPEVMSPAVEKTMSELQRLGVTLPVGVYANAFVSQSESPQANLGIQEIRPELDLSNYTSFATRWKKQGVEIIGGCCGIGPEHIHALHNALKEKVSR